MVARIRNGVLLLVATCGIAVGIASWRSVNRPTTVEPPGVETDQEVVTPPQVLDRGFVSSSACMSCHPNEHERWHHSYHRSMTQVASPKTVLAPFDGIEVKFRGQSARLVRQGDEFWVDMVDPLWEIQQFDQGRDVSYANDPPRVKQRIVMTTGSHHFQAFWVRSRFGRELWQFPWRYHLVEQRWVHRQNVFLEPPDMRPGAGFRVWNRGCIGCHSVGGKPGMNMATGDMVNTSVVELGISCEACHGPGRRHVEKYTALAQTAGANDKLQVGHPEIVNPAKLSAERSSQICGACHSQFVVHDPNAFMTDGLAYRAGEDITRIGTFMTPSDEGETIASRFWADGVSRSGGREYMGMVSSKCYESQKMSCLTCHSMHEYEDRSDQLAANMETNEACFQCHETYRENVSEHTHHSADSSGSLCYNCHMPHTSYALLKGIRDHSVSTPTVTPLGPDSRPSACNLCHLDQTLEWTAHHLASWPTRRGEPSDSVVAEQLSKDEREIAASLLYLLRGDAGQRVIAAYSMGWDEAQSVSNASRMVAPLAEALKDPYAAVRYNAFRALRKLPGFSDFDYDFEDAPDSHEVDGRVQERQQETAADATDFSRILLDDNGQPDREAIQRLVSERDNREIRVIE